MLKLLPRFRLPFPPPPPKSEATPSEVAGLELIPLPCVGGPKEAFEEFEARPPILFEPRLNLLFGSVEALIRPSTLGALIGESLVALLPLPDLALPSSLSRFAVDVEFEFEPKKPFPTLNPRFRPVPGRLSFPPPPFPSNSAPNSLISVPVAPGVEGVEVAAELDLDMPTLPPFEALT